ncbi:MAG: hypothetical protein AAFX87_29150 [Bacteroidota bacterium]
MSKKGIELLLNCNEDWDKMTPSGCGRHCAVCDKVVYDFTNKSIEEIRATPKRGSCGMFTAEQMEPDLIPIRLPSILRRSVFAAAALIGLSLVEAQAQTTPTKEKTEVVHGRKVEAVAYEHKTFDIRTETLSKSGVHPETRRKFKRKFKRKLYLSRRFPFIKLRRPGLVGFR